MPPFLSSKNFAFTITIILHTIPFSTGTNANYRACSAPFSCGPIKNIGYPFWRPRRPEFCGRPEFQLKKCHNSSDHPFIHTPWGKAKVFSLDTSTHKMTVSLHHFARDYPICPVENKTRDPDLSSGFKLGPGVINLSLFYGYSKNDSVLKYYTRNSFLCRDKDDSRNGSVLYLSNMSDATQWKNFTVPVVKRGLDEVKNGSATLLSVLRKRFELEYVVDFVDCLECQRSGGVCGSYVTSSAGAAEFVCHCQNASKLRTCHNSEKRKLGLILGLGITGSVIILIAITLFWYRKKLNIRWRKTVCISPSFDRDMSGSETGTIYFGVPVFSYTELEEATDSFHESNQLGDGGFGTVYCGKLKDGREVAVKRLHEKSYKRVEQFMNEVQILTCLKHQNLVSLYGCTSQHSKELLLVYEYIPNGTVADHLYGDKANKQDPLPWHVRINIAVETASALAYLHASDIIHRDVKTSNILLDNNFNVEVADFGLSRLLPSDVTHVSTAPQGTPGYMDPEYQQCYQLTDKSDVYSFGVVLLELISSLPAVDSKRHREEINLSSYAMSRIQRRAFHELVDPRLGFMSDFDVRRMTTAVAELAFQCLQHVKELRPSMDEVLESLRRIQSPNYEDLKAEDEGENHKSATILNLKEHELLSQDLKMDKYLNRQVGSLHLTPAGKVAVFPLKYATV